MFAISFAIRNVSGNVLEVQSRGELLLHRFLDGVARLLPELLGIELLQVQFTK